ncbi:MAG: hypothetical protein IKE03_06345 [Blautia sp.]|nr:hypothetical protein [Blautia sp.]
MNNFSFYSPTFFPLARIPKLRPALLSKDSAVQRCCSITAVRVWGCQMDFDHPEVTAAQGIEALRHFLAGLGMPQTLGELGGKEEDIPKLVDVLCNGDGRPGNISGFVTLDEKDCTAIYKMML